VGGDRSLGDLEHIHDRLHLALLLGRAYPSAQASLHARVELLARQLRVLGQPHPQRVLRLVGLRVVVAEVLVDDAQVEAEGV
jgi:hypothetical protein